MSLTIVHAADVHLDRAFTEQGLRLTGRARRQAIRDAFLRVLELASDADALCIAGDLYEHEHVTADTENMLVAKLGELSCPVLLLPGNHDPFVPGSVYERAEWPANVHVFSESTPEPFPLSDDVVVWGIAYTARELRPEVVRSFKVPSDGRKHLLLLHGSLIGSFAEAEVGHLPVTERELLATAADFVMLGHYHSGVIRGNACYPGSVEPLNWGERGTHAVNVLTVDGEDVSPDLRPINRLSFGVVAVDVTGAASSTEVEDIMRVRLQPLEDGGLTLRARLQGEVAEGCEIDPLDLGERCREGFADVVVGDETVPAYNLEEIAQELTVRGRFVAGLLKRAEDDPNTAAGSMAAARAGLRALEGRTDLLNLAVEPGGTHVD